MVAKIGRGRSLGLPYCALCRPLGAQAISLAYKIRNDPAALALLILGSPHLSFFFAKC